MLVKLVKASNWRSLSPLLKRSSDQSLLKMTLDPLRGSNPIETLVRSVGSNLLAPPIFMIVGVGFGGKESIAMTRDIGRLDMTGLNS